MGPDRKRQFIPDSKSKESRYSSLNSGAMVAIEGPKRRIGREAPVLAGRIPRVSLRGPHHWFGGAVREARLTDFTWHGLGHVFAGRFVMTGTDFRTIVEVVVEATIQMPMRYNHPVPARKQAVFDCRSTFGMAAQPEPIGARTITGPKRHAGDRARNQSKSFNDVLAA